MCKIKCFGFSLMFISPFLRFLGGGRKLSAKPLMPNSDLHTHKKIELIIIKPFYFINLYTFFNIYYFQYFFHVLLQIVNIIGIPCL